MKETRRIRRIRTERMKLESYYYRRYIPCSIIIQMTSKFNIDIVLAMWV